jgi:hypothetical protein
MFGPRKIWQPYLEAGSQNDFKFWTLRILDSSQVSSIKLANCRLPTYTVAPAQCSELDTKAMQHMPTYLAT